MAAANHFWTFDDIHLHIARTYSGTVRQYCTGSEWNITAIQVSLNPPFVVCDQQGRADDAEEAVSPSSGYRPSAHG